MPPPPSYFDITPVPFSITVTQAQFNGGTYGGTANQAWGRFVTTSDTMFGGVVNKGGTFVPRVDIYASDGTTLLFAFAASPNFASWHVFVEAGTYYVKITKVGGGSSDFDFDADFDIYAVLVIGDVVAGDALINDDQDGTLTGGTHTAVYSPNGTLKGYLINHLPGGEAAAMLPTGESAWYDPFGIRGPVNSIAIFDANLEYVTSLEFSDLFGGINPRLTSDGTQFYLLTIAAQEVWTMSAAGVPSGAPIATVAGVSNTLPGRTAGVGVSRDGSILYFTKRSGAGSDTIYRWDLVNDVALTDLYSVPGWDSTPSTDFMATTADGLFGEILTLSSGTLVLYYYKQSDNTSHLLVLSDTGVLLHDFDFDATNYTIDHIAYDTDDASIRVWFHNQANTIGRIAILDLSDGSLSAEVTFDMFIAGLNENRNSLDIWGPPESCPMVTFGFSSVAVTDLPRGNIGPIAWLVARRVQP